MLGPRTPTRSQKTRPHAQPVGHASADTAILGQTGVLKLVGGGLTKSRGIRNEARAGIQTPDTTEGN